jgi:transcriptional regulator with XRE-family HTH domain
MMWKYLTLAVRGETPYRLHGTRSPRLVSLSGVLACSGSGALVGKALNGYVQVVFAANIARLLGMHALTGSQAAKYLKTTEVAISAWRSGRRQPSLKYLLAIGERFEVPPHELMSRDFADLLAGPLGDPDRYRRVEQRIHKSRTKLQGVPKAPKVVPGAAPTADIAAGESFYETAAREQKVSSETVKANVRRGLRKTRKEEGQVGLGNKLASSGNDDTGETA